MLAALVLVGVALVVPQAAAPMAASPATIQSRSGNLAPRARRTLPPRSDGSEVMAPSLMRFRSEDD